MRASSPAVASAVSSGSRSGAGAGCALGASSRARVVAALGRGAPLTRDFGLAFGAAFAAVAFAAVGFAAAGFRAAGFAAFVVARLAGASRLALRRCGRERGSEDSTPGPLISPAIRAGWRTPTHAVSESGQAADTVGDARSRNFEMDSSVSLKATPRM